MSPSLRERFGFAERKNEPLKPEIVAEPELKPQEGPKPELKPENTPTHGYGPNGERLEAFPDGLAMSGAVKDGETWKMPEPAPDEAVKAPEPVKRIPLPIKQEEQPMPRVKDNLPEEGTDDEEQDDETENEEQDAEQENEGNEQGQDDVEEPSSVVGSKGEAPSKADLTGNFIVRKIYPRPTKGKDGKTTMKPVFVNVESYEGKPPTQSDVKECLVPLWGGGDYLVINKSTKRKVNKFTFEGEPIDFEYGNQQVSVAPPPLPMYAPAPTPAPAPAPEVKPDLMSKVAALKSSAQDKVLEVLEKTLENAVAAGNMDLVDKTLDRIVSLGNGGKSAAAPSGGLDPMIQVLMTMMNSQAAQSQQNLNTIVQIMSKERSGGTTMKENIEMMNAILGLSQKMGGSGEDASVAVVREVGGVVKDSMRDLTETVVQVTGSGPVKDKGQPAPERYTCEKCGNEVQKHWKVCPNCGLVFKAGILPPAKPPIKPTTEVFENKSPPIPAEVKSKMSYLTNLANFIRHKHDPEKKGQMLFKMCGPEERVALLFTAQFGYRNLMKMAGPYRYSKEIPDLDSIFKIVESPEGETWITRFFGAIKVSAAAEGVYLTEGDKEDFINRLNEHSAVKFNYRPKKESAPPALKVPVGKPRNEQPSVAEATVQCAICEQDILLKDYQSHLFTAHPKKPKEAPVEPEPSPEELDQEAGVD